MQERETEYAKHLNVYYPKTYIMCPYRVNQSILWNLYSILINKILVMEFITVSFTESKFDVKYVNTATQWNQ